MMWWYMHTESYQLAMPDSHVLDDVVKNDEKQSKHKGI